jgi:hypothetical protein
VQKAEKTKKSLSVLHFLEIYVKIILPYIKGNSPEGEKNEKLVESIDCGYACSYVYVHVCSM